MWAKKKKADILSQMASGSRVRCSKMRNQAGFAAASTQNWCENRKNATEERQFQQRHMKDYTYIIPARRREVNEN